MVERSAALRDEQREHLTVEPWRTRSAVYPVGRRRRCRSRSRAPGRSSAALEELPRSRSTGWSSPTSCSTTSRSAWSNAPLRLGRDAGRRPTVTVSSRSRSPPTSPSAPRSMPLRPERASRCSAGSRPGSPPAPPACTAVWSWSSTTRPAADLAARGQKDGYWLRTYRAHQRGDDPLDDARCAGHHDRRPAADAAPGRAPGRVHDRAPSRARPSGCARVGIDALVDEGRARGKPARRAATSRRSAGRSRITEAAALTDPDGLGAHTVLVLASHP